MKIKNARKGAALVGIICGCALLASCSADSVGVAGEVEVTEIYSDLVYETYDLQAPTCGSYSVQIENGAGDILSVAKTDVVDEDVVDSTSDSDIHTLTCSHKYSFEVDAADVYVVSLPKVDEETVSFGTLEQTLNRDESTSVEVPAIEFTKEPRLFTQ